MIYQPQQSGSNLGSALSMWNQFMQPGQSSPSQPPPGTYHNPQTDTDHAPLLGQDLSGKLLPQSQGWNGADPWFGAAQAPRQGTVSQDNSSSGNLGKAAGAASGLSGLLGSI